jgi:hypothetical protein
MIWKINKKAASELMLLFYCGRKLDAEKLLKAFKSTISTVDLYFKENKR